MNHTVVLCSIKVHAIFGCQKMIMVGELHSLLMKTRDERGTLFIPPPSPPTISVVQNKQHSLFYMLQEI